MLTDAQWTMLEPLIEACRPKGRNRPARTAGGGACFERRC
jgi:hypothetical protein